VSVPPSTAPAGSSGPAGRSGTPGGATPRAWPDAGNTGVPAGTSLRTHTGDLVVSTPGTVVDAMQVNGSIIVTAPDVKIRRTRVAAAAGSYWVVRQSPAATNLAIEDSELIGGRTHVGVSQEADGLAVRRCHIRRVDTGVSTGNRVTVEDSFVVDVGAGVGTSSGGSQVTVRHNVITTSASSVEAAVGLYTKDGPLRGVAVEGNLLAGGNYTFHVGEGPGSQQIVARHNRFSRAVHPKGGFFGPTAGWDHDAAGNVWQDNTWVDTGEQISV
jgi:hypothetical protein